MDYLPTLGEKLPHSRGNVGKDYLWVNPTNQLPSSMSNGKIPRYDLYGKLVGFSRNNVLGK